MDITIMLLNCQNSRLFGDVVIPSSKSHTLRAILFGSLASGESSIKSFLRSPDTNAMIEACKQFGAVITENDQALKVIGVSGHAAILDDVINVGNSGQVLRFMSAIAALQSNYAIFTGDYSIRHNRPMQPLIDGLRELGAFCVSTKNDEHAPIIVKGPIKPGKTTLNGEDSQPVSALLIASAFLHGKTEVFVKNPGEKPWIDLTLNWLDRINVKYINDQYEHYTVFGGANYPGFIYTVPGDFSSLLFPVAAALITQSEIILQNVDMNDVQGDKKVLVVLEAMGGRFSYNVEKRELRVLKTRTLKCLEIDVNDFIDSVPILAVIGTFAQGETIIKNAAIARKKECDRISAITAELKKMGADIEEFSDGLRVKQSRLIGASVNSYDDHRIAMSLAIAGLGAQGTTQVNSVNCIAKSYPSFYEDLKKLNASIELK